ncbi:ExbD/TolR family protein [Arvimicrobium flavum]|uniref:ExbD/TolR family protein n=1 Tax=Arvimicrobium flavum TaxID=3393320 RepID=UPI00237AAB7A|nr:biopolymer transporter ExbD [Mesorhizobium shangrilense]
MTAATPSAPLIGWRQRQRRVFFALTPLIDVMFLLLIFFMLSSQISPYSLVQVGGVGQASGAAPDEAANAAAAAPLAIRVSHGSVRIGGEDVVLAELQAAAERFVLEGVAAFVVVPSASANVQDIVTVLELLKAAEAKDVTLVAAGRSRP